MISCETFNRLEYSVLNNMSDSLENKLIVKLTDWLIAFCGAGLLILFTITQPVLPLQVDVKKQNIDVNKLQSHVRLLTEGYAPRTIEYDNLNYTASYIYSEFESLGDVKYQSIHTLSGQYNNVVLQLGKATKEVFVIGAHYDAENNSLDTEGNASGIAALIELARQLSKSAEQLAIRVVLVAYPLSQNQSTSLENTGSYYHADSLKKSGTNVRLMISLDSIGQFNNSLGSQKHPYPFMKLLYPEKGNYINLMGRLQDFVEVRHLKRSFARATALPLYSQNLPEGFEKTQSTDHKSYWKQGFPAVLISDTARYRNIDTTLQITERLDYVKMAMLVQGLYSVVMDAVTTPLNTQIVQEEQGSQVNLRQY